MNMPVVLKSMNNKNQVHLAKVYARRFKSFDTHAFVVWVNCSDKETLSRDFEVIAKKLKIPSSAMSGSQLFRDVFHHFNTRSTLLIFNHADPHNTVLVSTHDMFERLNNVKIIILSDIKHIWNGNRYAVMEMINGQFQNN